jgi:protein O-GlcNAc transferase
LQTSQISQYAEEQRQAGRLAEAATAYRKAIALEPGDPETHYNLGNICLDMGMADEAVASYLAAQALVPGHPQILLQLGNAYSAMGQPVEAVAVFRQAQVADPDNAAVHFNLGNALRELGQPELAAESYRSALRLTPADADSHNNLGNVLRELGRLDEAIACYETALRLNPALHHAKVHLIHQKQHVCDWRNLEADATEIRCWVAEVPQAQVSSFAFLAMPGTTAIEQKKCAENWSTNRFMSLKDNKLKNTGNSKIKGNEKLRVGYLSSDFRLHPLAFLITELIELHDRSQFEIHAYSYAQDDKTAERRRLEQAFDHFTDIRPLSLTATAHKINHDDIDILVDLTGFTQTSRSGIAALRPAPIQVNWLGFPGTMGAIDGTPLFDYILGDHFVTPPEQADCYSEKLALLPCYQPNDRHRPVGRLPKRQDCSLPEHAFVFCCFNQTFKILPQMFDIWMRILQAKPDSVLWLLDCNRWAKASLCHEAEMRGVSADRLVFAPRAPIADHLARHMLADLFLDTLPYNAHTTASDALWMGLPIVTCSGETFASRVAGSLLTAANLPQLVTDSLTDYEALAMRLAGHPDELAALRNHLRKQRDELPLFDTPRFTTQLEQAYATMWQKHAAGQPPQTFSVMLK